MEHWVTCKASFPGSASPATPRVLFLDLQSCHLAFPAESTYSYHSVSIQMAPTPNAYTKFQFPKTNVHGTRQRTVGRCYGFIPWKTAKGPLHSTGSAQAWHSRTQVPSGAYVSFLSSRFSWGKAVYTPRCEDSSWLDYRPSCRWLSSAYIGNRGRWGGLYRTEYFCVILSWSLENATEIDSNTNRYMGDYYVVVWLMTFKCWDIRGVRSQWYPLIKFQNYKPRARTPQTPHIPCLS